MTENHSIVIDLENTRIGCPYCDEWQPYFGTRGGDTQFLCNELLDSHLKQFEKMKEPTDTEILEFLLNQFQSHSLQMNGQHSYRFMNDGFPMNRAKGPSARDAIIVAMREQEESTRKFKEKYPEWSGE
jgi:hypothetical protein